MLYNPSVYAHIMNGGIFIIGIIYATVYIKKLNTVDYYQMLVLVLLFSIAIGVHGISHMGFEALYGYNPYVPTRGKTIEPLHPMDCPYRRYYNNPFLRSTQFRYSRV